MVKKRRLLVEGAGDRADLSAQCRKGFQRLFEKAGLGGALPRVLAGVELGEELEAVRALAVGARLGRLGCSFERAVDLALGDCLDVCAIGQRFAAKVVAEVTLERIGIGEEPRLHHLHLQRASPSAQRLFDALRRTAAD